MVIRKADLPAQDPLPREEIEVPELGGSVIVRGVGLTYRLAMATDRSSKARGVSTMLANCVLDADDEPLMSAEAWEAWGAKHIEASMRLADVALRLSGFNAEDTAKN